MLQLFPFLGWLAPIASGTLLVILWNVGELRRRTAMALVVVFLGAGYLQFLGSSSVVCASGRAIQTLLAIYLIVRWRQS